MSPTLSQGRYPAAAPLLHSPWGFCKPCPLHRHAHSPSPCLSPWLFLLGARPVSPLMLRSSGVTQPSPRYRRDQSEDGHRGAHLRVQLGGASRPEHVMCPEPLTWAGAVPWRPWGLAHPGSRGGLLALTLRRRKQDSLPTSPRGQTPTWQSPLGCVPALCPYLPGTRPLCEQGLVSLQEPLCAWSGAESAVTWACDKPGNCRHLEYHFSGNANESSNSGSQLA